MTDLSRLLRDALPGNAASLDLPAVVARSHQLTRRRRALTGGAAALVVATAAVAFAGGGLTQRVDRLGPAGEPTAPPSAADGGRAVQLYFTKGCGDISPVERRVDGPVLEASLRALFAGPTDDERAAGAESTFRAATAGLLRSVRTEGGNAYVDLDGSLRDSVPKGPDGSGCSNFAEQVGGTLRQFGGIAAVYYAYDGDPADFVTSFGGTCPSPPQPGGLCDPGPFGPPAPAVVSLKAPAAQRLDRTDEFGAVAGTTRLADGTLRVQVNRVDWLSGDATQAAAAAAAAVDGTDAGDYYVVDESPRTRTYNVSPAAKVYGSIRLTGVPDLTVRTLDDWTRFLSEGSRTMAGQNVQEQVQGTYFHFQIQDGLVVGIEEQYRP